MIAGWPLFPQSPGSRPGACMGQGKRAQVRMAILFGPVSRIEAPGASRGTVT